eukprot:contig_10097_g2414
MRRPGGSSSGGGSCGRVVVAGPSFYSSSGMPSGSSSGMPLGSSLDDCKPAWSTVNGSGPFGAAEDDALTAVSPNVVTFMNNTHRQDLALYALNYGDKLKDLALLDNVSLLSIDAMGAVLELLICCETDDSCVAILERLPWPDSATCTSVDDVVAAFGAMSIGVGLSGDI